MRIRNRKARAKLGLGRAEVLALNPEPIYARTECVAGNSNHAGVAAAIAAGVLLLMGVTASAHQKTAGFHCTASSQAPTATGHSASGRLVPKKPKALALCRYGHAPEYTLKGSRLVARQKTIRRVVRGLNALPEPPNAPVACPNDNGSQIVVYAMYKRAGTRIVNVGLSGCLIARRDNVVRWDLPSGGRFIRVLKDLTR